MAGGHEGQEAVEAVLQPGHVGTAVLLEAFLHGLDDLVPLEIAEHVHPHLLDLIRPIREDTRRSLRCSRQEFQYPQERTARFPEVSSRHRCHPRHPRSL